MDQWLQYYACSTYTLQDCDVLVFNLKQSTKLQQCRFLFCSNTHTCLLLYPPFFVLRHLIWICITFQIRHTYKTVLGGVYASYNYPLRTVYIICKNNFQYMWLVVLRAYFMYVGDKKLKKYIHDSWQWWLLETRLLNSIYICISFISIYIGDRA